MLDAYSQAPTTAMASKREQAKAKTRRALLKSALRLYSIEGAQGMSMNKVAKGAGIAQPSFYNHFDGLEALQNELSAQLQANYLSPMRAAWINMVTDYDTLSKTAFNERCQHCLTMIFEAAFKNIGLFQHLLEDRTRMGGNIGDTTAAMAQNSSTLTSGLGHLINDIQAEWTQIFIQGLQLANRTVDRTAVHLCVDMAAAQVHELILGCHQQRYSKKQAITALSASFDALFAKFLYRNALDNHIVDSV